VDRRELRWAEIWRRYKSSLVIHRFISESEFDKQTSPVWRKHERYYLPSVACLITKREKSFFLRKSWVAVLSGLSERPSLYQLVPNYRFKRMKVLQCLAVFFFLKVVQSFLRLKGCLFPINFFRFVYISRHIRLWFRYRITPKTTTIVWRTP
jgi:hypothetical protein